MNKGDLKKQVRVFRKSGKTYSEIKQALGASIPKSTLSDWCKNVKLPYWYDNKVKDLNNKSLSRAQKIAWASCKNQREILLDNVTRKASEIISRLDEANLKIILAVLYLGEGAKWKGHSGLMLGSSDPTLVLLYLKLLDRCYDIKPRDVKCRISYRVDQNIRGLEAFWSKTTGIPHKNFYKTKPDPRTFGKKTQNTEYKGVCVITCKGSVIQLELENITKLLLKRLEGR